MNINFFLITFFCFTFTFLCGQDLAIPAKIETEIYIKLKKFEGEADFKKNIEDILTYDHFYVEEIIFRKIGEIEEKKPAILSHLITILGNFDTARSILTLNKYAQPFLEKTDKDKLVPRPRHIRVAAIKAISQKLNEERIGLLVKLLDDADPIFQCILLKLLKEKEIKEAIDLAFNLFKKSYTDDTLGVKTDAACLVISISTDPQIKNSVILSMLMEPNIHIRKAGLTLINEGGMPGDAEVRRKLVDLLKSAKEEELELACKAVGTIKLNEAKDNLLLIINREKSPFIKWECANSLHKINFDSSELNTLINKIITEYKTNGPIKNNDQERFKVLLDSFNAEKEQK